MSQAKIIFIWLYGKMKCWNAGILSVSTKIKCFTCYKPHTVQAPATGMYHFKNLKRSSLYLIFVWMALLATSWCGVLVFGFQIHFFII